MAARVFKPPGFVVSFGNKREELRKQQIGSSHKATELNSAFRQRRRWINP